MKVKNPHYWRRDAEIEAMQPLGSVPGELPSRAVRAVREAVAAVRVVEPALGDRRELADLAAALAAPDASVVQALRHEARR